MFLIEGISTPILLHIGKQTQVMAYCAEHFIIETGLLKCEGKRAWLSLVRNVGNGKVMNSL